MENLSSELGLSQNMINCIMQDDKGFLWVGTKDGLNRFDGYRFKVYRNDPFDSTSLSNNFVNDIVQDQQGRIWVSTFQGLNLLAPDQEVFHRISPDMEQGIGLRSEKIQSLLVDSRDRIWLNTDDGILHLLEMPPDSWNIKDLKIRQIPQMKNPSGTLEPVFSDKLLQDKAGVFWAHSRTNLFRFWEDADGQFSFTDAFPEATDPAWRAALEGFENEKERFFVMGPGKDGAIWVACPDKIGHWDPAAARWRLYPLATNKGNDPPISWNEVSDLLEDSQGQVWITPSPSLLHFDPATGVAQSYFPQKNQEFPAYFWTTWLFEDKSGILWIGTKGRGLLKFNRRSKRFVGKGQGDPNNFLWKGLSLRAICKTTDGQILISSSSKGIFRYHPESNDIAIWAPSEKRLQGEESIYAILEDPSGIFWLGSEAGLIKVQKGQGGQYQIAAIYPPVPGSDRPKHNWVWAVVEGRSGDLWTVTSTQLCHFDPATEKFTNFTYLPEKKLTILNNEFPSLYMDHKGILWVGTSEGLLHFDPAVKRFRHFYSDANKPGSLNQNMVKAILSDPTYPDKYLWAGTGGGGLNRFDRGKEQFEYFTEKDGLPNMTVYAILPDDAGNLWMSTNKGLSVLNPTTLQFRNFDEEDGIQNLEFNSASFYKSKDGQFFFGGIQGFNGFYPKDMLTVNDHVPPIVFIDFKLDNKSVSLKDKNSPLEKAIPYSEETVLGYEYKSLSFEFAALDFSEPSKNQFAYKMEGFDTDWQQAGHSNTATYTNLPPGNYTFHARGSNNDGVWNEQGASVRILILPPWWRTWWAYLGYILSIGGLLLFFWIKENQRQILQRNLAREQAETERQKELSEAKSIFLSTVSHELRTPLTSIMGFSKIIKTRLEDRLLPFTDVTDPRRAKSAEQVVQNLDIVISESERLTNLINQVLDLAKIEAGKVEWQKEKVDMAEVAERATATVASLFEQKNILLLKNIEQGLPPIIGDSNELMQVLINLLSNSLKFTEKGKVVISMFSESRHITTRIEDTGIGISERDQKGIFDKFRQVGDDTLTNKPRGTGLGLSISQEIIKHHGGKIWVESELGKGSVFFFTLPLEHEIRPS